MPLEVQAQADFSGGAYQAPSRELIPQNGAYSILNGLLETDGSISRRGGSTLKATLGLQTITFLWDGYLIGGARTVYGSSAGLGVMDAGDTTGTLIGGTGMTTLRPAAGNGVFAQPLTNDNILAYAGSRGSNYSTGTASTVRGSTTVTGVGTSWVANVVRGDILSVNTGPGIRPLGVVASVTSNTSLELTVGAYDTYGPVAYTIRKTVEILTAAGSEGPVSAIATVGNPARLCIAYGSKLFFNYAGDFFAGVPLDYHMLPQGAQVLGMESLRNILFVFSTQGIFTISGMDFDLTDAFGNVQHRMDQINRDIILWDQRGIAGARNSLIVPGVDDVYLITDSAAPQALSAPISTLYRQYVAAGYQCGGATVFRNHYFLPILNGATWVDTLVFRLDGGGWTQWSGDAATSAWMATRGSSGTARRPQLLSVYQLRLQDLTGTFTPTSSNKNDADGTTFPFEVVTRDYTTGGLRNNLVKKVRLGYELVDAGSDNPTITAAYATGGASTSFTTLADVAGETDGASTEIFNMGEVRPRFIRFKFRSTSPAARMIVKSVEVMSRQGGRQ